MARKFCIVSYHTVQGDYAKMGAINAVNIDNYASKYGYDYKIIKGTFTSREDAFWSKINVIIDTMEIMPENTWIMWHDIDALITNYDISLDQIIGKSTGSLIISCDYSGLNNGVFFIKNNNLGRTYMNYVLKIRTRADIVNSTTPEQTAMKKTLELFPWSSPSFADYRPQNTFNSFPVGLGGSKWSPGDFIVHFAGIPRKNTVKLMLDYQRCPRNMINKYKLLNNCWYLSIGLSVFFILQSKYITSLATLTLTQAMFLAGHLI